MTKEKSFKRRVRDRMSKTGESYTSARSKVAQKRDRVRSARAKLAVADERPSDAKVKEATGKDWEGWFSILDQWGAHSKKHPEMVRFLIDEHGVPGWWAQTVTVTYERARGMRLKHQGASGFSVGASKTIAVPIDVLTDAVLDARTRRKWLTDGTMSRRPSRADRTARFDWEGGSTRVVFYFTEKGPAKSMVAMAHESLPDADEAETKKVFWRERLRDLKVFLETRPEGVDVHYEIEG